MRRRSIRWYFERAYYLTPAGQSNKAYRLLARVMEETGRAGIATFVMRTKEYLVAILAEKGILRAETLRFADELRTPESIGLPEPADPPAAAVKRMDREIGKRLEQRLDTKELEDDTAERLEKLVRGKVRSGQDVVHLEEPDDRPSDVIDLMEILKRRLQGEQEDTPAGSAAPAPRKSASKTPRKPRSKASSTKKPRSAKNPAGAAKGARDTDLRESSKADLLEQAQKLDIPGRSGMSKDELVKAIRRSA